MEHGWFFVTGTHNDYAWNGEYYGNKEAALLAGQQAVGSDGFNIGEVDQNGALIWFGWYDMMHPQCDWGAVASFLRVTQPHFPEAARVRFSIEQQMAAVVVRGGHPRFEDVVSLTMVETLRSVGHFTEADAVQLWFLGATEDDE